jgi:uncharacterized protein
MKIKVTHLSNGLHAYDFSGAAEDIGLEAPFINGYKLHVDIDKANRHIVADCLLELQAEFICDRCNSAYVGSIVTDFELVYFLNAGGSDAEIPDDDEVEVIPPYEDKIDLTSDIYEYANLALPMKKVCREDCKGICPQCGLNLNESSCDCKQDTIDDRWKPLLELKNKVIDN